MRMRVHGRFQRQGSGLFGRDRKRVRIGKPARQIRAPAGPKEARATDQELAMLESARTGEERVCRGRLLVRLDVEVRLIATRHGIWSGAIIGDGQQAKS